MDKMKYNRRILIVDDEPYNILALQVMLSQSGYPNIYSLIDVANNGQEALEKVKFALLKNEYSYGLILMDMSMPVMDGYQASQNIRHFVK